MKVSTDTRSSYAYARFESSASSVCLLNRSSDRLQEARSDQLSPLARQRRVDKQIFDVRFEVIDSLLFENTKKRSC